jgi:D-alanyl-D-alanine carboxypeptidase
MPVVAEASGALARTVRPLPRALASVEISRNSASIAAAIAEVNSALASRATRSPVMAAEARPLPRPGVPAGADEPPAGVIGRASTFAVAEVVTPLPRDATVETVSTASAGTTGGNEWGVQLGSYRAKGDAERQLLTTALMDVPELSGGLRRVEAARVQGVTVYRAQFVGLDQAEALAACASLARKQADCLPLAPGI